MKYLLPSSLGFTSNRVASGAYLRGFEETLSQAQQGVTQQQISSRVQSMLGIGRWYGSTVRKPKTFIARLQDETDEWLEGVLD